MMLFLPLLTAILNRVRGEGIVPKSVWYAVMTLLAAGLNPYLMGAWLLYFVGYAMMPWQAMFSAVNGDAPSRQDHWLIQWMQPLTLKLTGANYHLYGIVYGVIRASLMIPGVVALMAVTGSFTPLIGLLGLSMGLVYYLCGRFSRHSQMGNAFGVPLAELVMGWWHGTFILLCA